MTFPTPNTTSAHCRSFTRWQLAATLISTVMLLSGCNPKAIPTVIFPAKPELPTPPLAVPPLASPVVEIPSKVDVTVNLFARDIINPDSNGLASPVRLRIYLADNVAMFSKASFEQVFEFDNQKFDLQPVAVKTLRPGTVTSISLSLESRHKALAVAAAYRDIGKSRWLAIVPLSNITSNSFNFSLSDYIVAYEKPDE